MKFIIALFVLLPILSFGQQDLIATDKIGETGRIQFLGLKDNIFLGEGAGSMGSGGSNTFIGQNTGIVNLSGTRNLFIGSSAGSFNTQGSYNIFLGVRVGNGNRTGFGNVNIGDEAGQIDVSGINNVRIGDWAGRLSQGSRNVFIGKDAGYNLLGNDQLFIENTTAAQPLLHGYFVNDSLIVNGDLTVMGDLIDPSILVSNITGLNGNGSDVLPLDLADNTAELTINGVLASSNVLITKSIGFEIDTFSLPGSCESLPNIGYTTELPLTFETDSTSDINALQNWFSNPTPKTVSIIIKDSTDVEAFRFDLLDYLPSSSSVGSGGRTSFTLKHNLPPNNSVATDINEYLGSSFSFIPGTDTRIEITSVIIDCAPVVQVDYAKKIITLEMTYDEGAGLVDWINGVASGMNTNRESMAIIETTDGFNEISRENFFEVLPFKYEVIYGFGLNTKIRSRIQLLYGCNAPG